MAQFLNDAYGVKPRPRTDALVFSVRRFKLRTKVNLTFFTAVAIIVFLLFVPPFCHAYWQLTQVKKYFVNLVMLLT